MNLNSQQKTAIQSILEFLKNKNEKMFLLEGNAGTGKSTVITYLLQNRYFNDKQIAMTATTNKAVSVLNNLVTEITNNIKFMTTHKLLNFKRSIDNSGQVLYQSNLNNLNWELNKFTKNIFHFDIIIIDECSMINKSMLNDIIRISKQIKGKIIFLGDNSQLPPINEKISNVFNLKISKSVLTKVMRNDSSITTFANSIRELIINKNHKIKLKKFLSDDFIVKKEYISWYNDYVTDFKSKKRPIILAFTNEQCKKHNDSIRKKIFNTDEKYVKDEIIVFNGFYKTENISYYTSQQQIIKNIDVINVSIQNIDFGQLLNLKNKKIELAIEKSDLEIDCPICYEESVDFTIETHCKHYFCATCIRLWLKKNNECPMCRSKLIKEKSEIIIRDDEILTKKLFDLKEESQNLIYKCWSIGLEEGNILVVHEDNIIDYENKLKYIHKSLIDIRSYIEKKYLNNFSKILLNRLWEFYYNNIYDKFADISYGYSITTHKSQGSTYNCVYVDMKNIITINNDHNSKYKCLYTASTRASEKLSLAI